MYLYRATVYMCVGCGACGRALMLARKGGRRERRGGKCRQGSRRKISFSFYISFYRKFTVKQNPLP